METIKTYIDNVFVSFPQTDEIKKIKRDMLANMEEKYTILRQSGKSEHEAAYSVIANFGNIEEIIAELGLDAKNKESDINVFVSSDEAQTYISKAKKSGIAIGFGVWLIMTGVSMVMVMDNAFILFIAIAVAVAIFIITASKMSTYASFNETPIHLDNHTRQMIEGERTIFAPQRTAMVVVGVALIILSAGAFTVIDYPVAIFLNIIGFSVFLFILAGSHGSAYDVLLDKGDYENKLATKEIGRIIGTVAPVYWPIVTELYLSWSILRDAWGISWVVWPVAGVIFGAISAGISVWYGTKKKK